MSLEQKITDAMKTAMKEKDRVALDSLRAVKAQILLLKTEHKGAEVSEEQEIAILQRMIKQRFLRSIFGAKSHGFGRCRSCPIQSY